MPTQPINPGMKAAESAHGSNCREQIPLKCAFLRCRSRWSRITNFSGKDCICNRGSLCGPGGAKILLGSLKQVQERNLYSRPHHVAHGCGGQKLPQKNCLFGKRVRRPGENLPKPPLELLYRVRSFYGTIACASFEYALSLPLPSTAVAT